MTLYDILEVSPSASDEVIKMAYKALAKKYHPDLFEGDKDFADCKMKEINNAFDILSDIKLRADYDQQNLHRSSKENKEDAEPPYKAPDSRQAQTASDQAPSSASYQQTAAPNWNPIVAKKLKWYHSLPVILFSAFTGKGGVLLAAILFLWRIGYIKKWHLGKSVSTMTLGIILFFVGIGQLAPYNPSQEEPPASSAISNATVSEPDATDKPYETENQSQDTPTQSVSEATDDADINHFSFVPHSDENEFSVPAVAEQEFELEDYGFSSIAPKVEFTDEESSTPQKGESESGIPFDPPAPNLSVNGQRLLDGIYWVQGRVSDENDFSPEVLVNGEPISYNGNTFSIDLDVGNSYRSGSGQQVR